MLIADGEAFWKPPNIFDVAGAVGLVVGLGSIWLSWWLAKQDIKKRLQAATEQASREARDQVRRVARAVLHSGVAVTVRSFELAREVCNGKRWSRTIELCILAREQLAKVLAQPSADESVQNELRGVSAALQDCVTRLRMKTQSQEGKGTIPDGVLNAFDEAIIALHRVEGKMTGIQPEEDRG